MSSGHDKSRFQETTSGVKEKFKEIVGHVEKWFTDPCRKCGNHLSTADGSRYYCSHCHIMYVKRTSPVAQDPPGCNFPGCNKKCYVENSGHIHDYCSRSHANEHKEMLVKYYQRQRSQQDQHPHSTSHSNTSHDHHRPSRLQHTDFSTGPIKFYNREDPYYEFTNFYHVEIEIDGKRWPTTEHYFQAQKFVGTRFVEHIRLLPRPRDAFQFARNPQVSQWRRRDWEEVKIDVMRKALLAKFTQNKGLKELLVGTGERELIEDSPYDSFWGNGGDGSGTNHLGKLLVETRSKLRNGKPNSLRFPPIWKTPRNQVSDTPTQDAGSKLQNPSDPKDDLDNSTKSEDFHTPPVGGSSPSAEHPDPTAMQSDHLGVHQSGILPHSNPSAPPTQLENHAAQWRSLPQHMSPSPTGLGQHQTPDPANPPYGPVQCQPQVSKSPGAMMPPTGSPSTSPGIPPGFGQHQTPNPNPPNPPCGLAQSQPQFSQSPGAMMPPVTQTGVPTHQPTHIQPMLAHSGTAWVLPSSPCSVPMSPNCMPQTTYSCQPPIPRQTAPFSPQFTPSFPQYVMPMQTNPYPQHSSGYQPPPQWVPGRHDYPPQTSTQPEDEPEPMDTYGSTENLIV